MRLSRAVVLSFEVREVCRESFDRALRDARCPQGAGHRIAWVRVTKRVARPRELIARFRWLAVGARPRATRQSIYRSARPHGPPDRRAPAGLRRRVSDRRGCRGHLGRRLPDRDRLRYPEAWPECHSWPGGGCWKGRSRACARANRITRVILGSDRPQRGRVRHANDMSVQPSCVVVEGQLRPHQAFALDGMTPSAHGGRSEITGR